MSRPSFNTFRVRGGDSGGISRGGEIAACALLNLCRAGMNVGETGMLRRSGARQRTTRRHGQREPAIMVRMSTRCRVEAMSRLRHTSVAASRKASTTRPRRHADDCATGEDLRAIAGFTLWLRFCASRSWLRLCRDSQAPVTASRSSTRSMSTLSPATRVAPAVAMRDMVDACAAHAGYADDRHIGRNTASMALHARCFNVSWANLNASPTLCHGRQRDACAALARVGDDGTAAGIRQHDESLFSAGVPRVTCLGAKNAGGRVRGAEGFFHRR